MSAAASKRQAAREVIDILTEAKLIELVVKNTRLDRPTLSLCVSLIENGIDPEVLATVIKELRRENRKAQQLDGPASD